ncbi:hypothetical protein Mp_4g15360 [Marchantia polymorpha subsp. ruderalis]|uniref:Uncharacterized protein n=2 Tax=Marchantia polymorpha TaxID=3197 RepID=A0AAF6BA62_MARPO|nr:hypothetical protein MARPO_0129s0049 [Marchantia polymorpha]PTQ30862.1 hypothetical protein MARPO_0119s0059 [Marchantia polymorpha]BBN08896.1 hypothetical protein Mp_4g15350 [Marchantia polymorpha subsp. ruderalis]BBN08897.1 hypothetical protein Mp_4g15360 [Marchantia polymorpha subsp. ruderalis]|eukprot:PTQ30168.1 hypothetical protein MARPO_0129s0049 [Marchantia polymorpha]
MWKQNRLQQDVPGDVGRHIQQGDQYPNWSGDDEDKGNENCSEESGRRQRLRKRGDEVQQRQSNSEQEETASRRQKTPDENI